LQDEVVSWEQYYEEQQYDPEQKPDDLVNEWYESEEQFPAGRKASPERPGRRGGARARRNRAPTR